MKESGDGGELGRQGLLSDGDANMTPVREKEAGDGGVDCQVVWMVWQSHRGVLEPKLAERGVTCPPGTGLPHCLCWAQPLDGDNRGGGGTCLDAKMVVDFRGQWLGPRQPCSLGQEPGRHVLRASVRLEICLKERRQNPQ